MFEQRCQRKLQTQPTTDAGKHLSHQQGMATELEEVVVATDPLHLEHLGPDFRETPFQPFVRCDEMGLILAVLDWR
ncbi:hypothetical protein LT20_02546 [Pseudomonas aeruginosa]|nr:hypothetical protein LT17_04362 [Pseudomonas aeruginosa]KYO97650.1 hypothetical protein LT20_02546 [Pseudomonas aeruginosa]RCM99088.1 hypothetical protein C3O68_05725 [Pseudomonas aeruginosa]RCN02607.1 hypothetical protein C3O69_05396 [Pseudomonas aeruginosa]RCN03279.1 hypothetical protein PA40_04761 [Pseudomonas aeruginosa]